MDHDCAARGQSTWPGTTCCAAHAPSSSAASAGRAERAERAEREERAERAEREEDEGRGMPGIDCSESVKECRAPKPRTKQESTERLDWHGLFESFKCRPASDLKGE